MKDAGSSPAMRAGASGQVDKAEAARMVASARLAAAAGLLRGTQTAIHLSGRRPAVGHPT